MLSKLNFYSITDLLLHLLLWHNVQFLLFDVCFLSDIVEPLYDDPRGGVVPPPPIAIWEELEGAGQHAKNLSTLIN